MENNIVTEEVTVSFTYALTINTDTGELLKSELVNKKTSKKQVADDTAEPQLILEDNKFKLTDSAVKLMNLSLDSKLDIKYEKNGAITIPILGTDAAFGTKSGNKLTKTNTVSFRGSKNEELAKYGTVFTIIPHETKEGLFKLKGDKEPISIAPPEEIEVPVNLSDLDVNIEDVTEIDTSFFNL